MTNPDLPATNGESNPDPHPWERQAGEPLDRYRWFQVYICLPRPRTFKAVTHIVGLKPASKLVPRTARHWRWKERAAATDDRQTGFPALQADWRRQFISEIAYQSRFISLAETTRALAGAQINAMDRAGARKHFNTLLQHQRGLLRLAAPHEDGARDKDEDDRQQRLESLVEERAQEMYEALFKEILDRIFADSDKGAPDGPGNGGSHQPASVDGPGQLKPWYQQPGEPAGHFYLFQIYLSLMFLQSTAQVARMAGFNRKYTLDKIARKWDWQQRAAAFDAEYAAEPSVRVQLRERLYLDQAYTARLQGLLDTARALETAQLGKLSRARARNAFASLSRHQRSLLQPAFRQQQTIDENIFEQSPPPRLDPHIEKLARQRAREKSDRFDEEARKSGFGD